MGFVVLMLCACLAAPAAGWWLSRRSPKWWGPAMGGALLITVCYPVVARRADWMLALYPGRAFAWVDDIWWIPFAAFFLSVAAAQVDSERRLFKLPAVAMAAFLVLLGMLSTGWTLSGATVTSREYVDDDGVTRQTTLYTCGAASAATLVRAVGVHRTEAEMAKATGVVPGRGTTFVKAYWGLRETLGDDRFDVEMVRVEEPTRLLPTPCMAGLSQSALLNHFVMIRAVTAEGAVVDDPWRGRKTIPLDTLTPQWLGVVIAVTPK